MELLCLGLSHQSAPLSVREKLAMPQDRQAEVLQRISAAGVEVLLISTCNRVEFYAASRPVEEVRSALKAEIARIAGEEALGHLYEHSGEGALVHLFRVSSSLDSMVLGEQQILGQVKDSLELAQKAGAARGEVIRACSAAFSTAKRVRSETAIGRAAVSMASAAVELAQKIFGTLKGRSVAVVGAGEIAELAARHFASAGGRIAVTNRTLSRAEALAAEVGGVAHPFEKMHELLVATDVVVTCTASPAPIFDKGNVGAVLKPRKHRPLFFVDLAVPRDVAPDVGSLSGVYAYDVDDLQKVVAENTAARAAEAARAEVIVAEEVARFVTARAQRNGVPVVATLRKHAERIARNEVERTLSHWGGELSEKQRKSVEAMGMAIVNKLLHQPTAKLRASGTEDARLADAAAELFGLDEPAPPAAADPPALAAGGAKP